MMQSGGVSRETVSTKAARLRGVGHREIDSGIPTDERLEGSEQGE